MGKLILRISLLNGDLRRSFQAPVQYRMLTCGASFRRNYDASAQFCYRIIPTSVSRRCESGDFGAIMPRYLETNSIGQ